MPVSECEYCGGEYRWQWEDAFDKFGFNDGDGQVETWSVEEVLTGAGYDVEVQQWGLHNTVIVSLKKGGKEFIPMNDPQFTFGYDCPRLYLPEEITELLDKKLPFR